MRTKNLGRLWLVCLLAMPTTLSAQGKTGAKAAEDVFDFGKVGLEQEVEHTFHFQNTGTDTLEIKNVQLTVPLIVTKMASQVKPGDTGSVTIRLDKPRKHGEFFGRVVVNFKGEDSPNLHFRVEGEVVPPIAFHPFPAFFVSTQRGHEKMASIEIVSHEAEPIEILRVEHTSSRFTTEVETLEPGRRFRLSLTVKGDGPAGRMTDTITLVTSSREHPFLKVQANTILNERVHTFPDAIDFGTISTQYLKAHLQAAKSLTISLMVYQDGGEDFQISAQTDVPFLELSMSQAHLKDRYEVRLGVVPEKLKSGEVNGTVVIVTNDPEFRRLTIPVRAVIEGSW